MPYGDMFYIRIPDGPLYLIHRLETSCLNYGTDEDLQKLLKLSKSDKVIIKQLFEDNAFGDNDNHEMTLEEACKIIGEEVVARHFDGERGEPSKWVNLFTKEVLDGMLI